MDIKTPKKTRSTTGLRRTGIAAFTLLLSSTAAAELQVGALMDGRGSQSLVAGDLQRADKALPNKPSRGLSYADTNNLCVLQILQRSESGAIATCRSALSKLKSTSMRRHSKSSISAEVYNNLAVAQLLAGELQDAQKNLAKALSLSAPSDGEPSNAEANSLAFRQGQKAGES